MSFADWVSNGWLVAHKSSKQEVGSLLRIVRRDLKDSEAQDVSNDWRFAIAYNAALQAAIAALAVAGYRTSGDSHHYRVIQSLELTIGKHVKFVRALDGFRRKRNISNYDASGRISDREVEEMIGIARALREDIERWISVHHKEYL